MMRAFTVPRAMRVIVVVIGLACSAPQSAREPASVDDTGRAASAAVPAPWYRAERTLDLTGDGKPDSVRLEATGARLDSLRIVLSLLVAGEVEHREEWGSSYELALVDSAVHRSSQGESVLRARLDSALASVAVQRLDAPGVRLTAEDSVILTGLVPRPTHRISFSYGYESTTRLVWDAAGSRFVRLWSCC